MQISGPYPSVMWTIGLKKDPKGAFYYKFWGYPKQVGLRYHADLWIKHKPHILDFKTLYYLVTKFLLLISNCSPVCACHELKRYHHCPTTESLEFYFTYLPSFLQYGLKILQCGPWADKIKQISQPFLWANLATVSRAHAGNESGPTEILQEVAGKGVKGKGWRSVHTSFPHRLQNNAEHFA